MVICGATLALHGSVLAQGNDVTAEDLLEMDIEDLLNVEVTVASKKSEAMIDAPGIVVAVPREEIEMYGDRNLFQLMERQPSVYTRSSFAYSDNQAAFRGNMSAHSDVHTLLLLNGRPIRESAQGHSWPVYMMFPMEALEGVELIRGPGSVLYGTNAFTGVVNLKSRKVPDKSELSFSTMAGSYGSYNTTMSGGGKSGDVGFTGAFQVNGQRGYRYGMIDQGGIEGSDNEHSKNISGTAHLDYQRFSLDVFGADSDVFTMGVKPLWSNPDHKARTRRLFVNTGYNIPIHERVDMDLNLTYNLQENSLSTTNPTRIGNNSSDILGEATIHASPRDNLDFVVGYLQEYQKNYSADSEYFQSIPSYDYEPKSLYAQSDYRFNKCLKFIAGTQWNKSNQGVSDSISRYGVIITPFEKWGLKLLRGEAFRGPVAMESDLYDPPILVGNDDLEPETITTYDAQLFYHDEKTYAAVTYFNSIIDKQIIFDTSGPVMSYKNGGEQEFNGIEFEGKHFLTPKWHMLGSFMHQERDADVGINPTVVPENMFKFGMGRTWDWGSASIFYTFFGTPPRVSSPVVVNPTPEAINLISMNVRVDTSEWMGMKKGRSVLTLRVENLLNEKIYVPTMAYTGSPNSLPYGPGATFYLGLTMKF